LNEFWKQNKTSRGAKINVERANFKFCSLISFRNFFAVFLHL